MPIPSLNSALKSRSQIQKAKDTTSRSEVPRQPADDEPASSDDESTRQLQYHDSSLSAQQSDGVGVKRRSFLPQRGLPKPISRLGGLADAPVSDNTKHENVTVDSKDRLKTSDHISSQRTGAPQQGRLRPRSLYQTSTANRTEDRPADVVNKPSQPVGLSRSQSLRRPGLPTQPVQPLSRSHTRTQSTSTVTGARQQSGTGSRTERPKSLIAPNHATKPTSLATADTANGGAVRASARLEALRRSASTRAKPEVSNVRTIPSTSSSSIDPPQPQARRREATKEEPKKLARPAFSTLQQHFTPRKTGKAPTSAFLHPVSDHSSEYLPPDIISLQTELLQLHLLHEASAQTNSRWELSAQKSLREKFDEVASLYQVMREEERVGQEQKNILALREWNVTNSVSGLVEHIQALSGPLHELPTLLDSGSRFHRLVEAFDDWILLVEAVQSQRKGLQVGRSDRAGFESLDDVWKKENAALMRKLIAYLRHIDRLPQSAPGSSIACIVSVCRQLLEGLIGELQIMQTIEASIMAQERQWIENRLRTIAQEPLELLEEGDQAWRK